MSIQSLITSTATLDDDMLEYVLSYFNDPSNDFSKDGLMDFLCPILTETGANDDQVDELCVKLLKITTNSADNYKDARKLDTEFKMQELVKETKSKVDLQHVAGRQGKSIVDEKKLRAAEARLIKKREAKGNFFDADGIPIWNPDVKPDIIVNQAKASGADSRSKDVKISNFDISFAGKKILTNADLSMSYGRRYGLVGKNGIGFVI